MSEFVLSLRRCELVIYVYVCGYVCICDIVFYLYFQLFFNKKEHDPFFVGKILLLALFFSRYAVCILNTVDAVCILNRNFDANV